MSENRTDRSKSRSAIRNAVVCDALEQRRLLSTSTNPSLGIMFNDEATSTGLINSATSYTQKLGTQAVRLFVGFDWDKLSTTPAKDHPFAPGMDSALNAAFKLHNTTDPNTGKQINVMVVLSPNGGTRPSSSSQVTTLIDDVLNYTQKASSTKASTVIDRWEIGNETDSSGYWNVGSNESKKQSLQDYVQLFLEPAAAELRAAGSNEEVVSAGPSYDYNDVGTISNQLIADNKLNSIDAFGYHPYGNSGTGTASVIYRSQHARTLVDSINANNGTSKKLYATEWNIRDFYDKTHTNSDGTKDGIKNGNRQGWADALNAAFPTVLSSFDTEYVFALIDDWRVKASTSGISARPGSALAHTTSTDINSSLKANPNFYATEVAWQDGRVTGTVFGDANGNGSKDGSENGATSARAYIDLNNNNLYDSGEPYNLTDSSGNYKLVYTTNGTSTSDTPPAAITLTNGKSYTLRVDNGAFTAEKTFVAAPLNNVAVNLGVPTTPTTGYASGIFFSDTNGDGVQNNGEVGAARGVWVDDNQNGVIDAGEQQVTSDASGTLPTLALTPGVHYLRRISPPSGYRVSTATNPFDPKGVIKVNITVGQTTAYTVGSTDKGLYGGTVTDTDGTALAGWKVFYDGNNNGVIDTGEETSTTDGNGAWKLGSLPSGAARSIVLQSQANYAFSSPSTGKFSVTPAGGDIVSGENFVVQAVATGTLVGTFFSDTNGDGIQNNGEVGAARSIWLDDNQNGVIDNGEPQITSSASGVFPNLTLSPGIHYLRRVGPPSGYRVSTATNPFDPNGLVQINVTAGQTTTYAFGSTDKGLYGGTVTDTNGTPLAGWNVFYDLNNNGTYDTGEEISTTDKDGAWQLGSLPSAAARSIVLQLQTGYTLSSPSTGTYSVTPAGGDLVSDKNFVVQANTPTPPPTGSISGHLWSDTNGNGVFDAADTQTPPSNRVVFLDLNGNNALDSGEPTTTSDVNGDYAFTGLDAGDFHVRRDLSTLTTYRLSNIPDLDVSIEDGQNLTGVDIGTSDKVLLTGSVFKDTNANGVQDNGESGFGSNRVYVDTNNNGVFDSGVDPSATTDSNGAWTIYVAPNGTYNVRTVLSTGWTFTSPSGGSLAYTSSSSPTNAGKEFSGLNFGERTV